MSIFEFLSDTDCTQTVEYMESLVDHMEDVLEEDFGIAVKNDPSDDPTEEVLRLLVYLVLPLSAARTKPKRGRRLHGGSRFSPEGAARAVDICGSVGGQRPSSS